MKKLKIFILLFTSLFVLSSFNHPIKLTSSEIRFDADKKGIVMECKVFMDDFSLAFFDPSGNLYSRMTTSSLTDDDIKRIESYFVEKYKILLNGEKLSLKFDSYKVKDIVMSIQFSTDDINLKKGDELFIENQLLFELFNYQQSNWITLNLKPYISNHNFACKLKNYTYTHTF